MFVKRKRRRVPAVVLPILIALSVTGLLSFASRAWAPPSPDVPNVALSKQCVSYGDRLVVNGFGFSPNKAVVVSSPQGHYTGPPVPSSRISEVTVRSDGTGAFVARLITPHASARFPSGFQPRVVFAEQPVNSRRPAPPRSSFAAWVLASRSACGVLEARR